MATKLLVVGSPGGQNGSALVWQGMAAGPNPTVNPIFILIMLPLFSYALYPAIGKIFRLTPLRKFGMGLFLTALAFLVVALIQVRIDAGERPHIIWQILAFLVLTAAEVMVSVTHLEFAYTQAPRKMKSLVMCTYLGAVALGNVFTAAVNFLIQNPDGTVKLAGASYFLFFRKDHARHVSAVPVRCQILSGQNLYPERSDRTAGLSGTTLMRSARNSSRSAISARKTDPGCLFTAR